MEKQDNSLSLSLMPAGKYRERTRESGYAIIIPLQVFLPTRNADIRKITRPRRETGLSRRDGVSAIVRARGKRKRWGRVKLFVNFRFASRLRDPPPPSIRRHYFAFQPRFAIVVKRFLASSKRSVLRRSRCVIVIDDVTRDRARALSSREREVCVCVCAFTVESITIILNNRAISFRAEGTSG